jgi:hypothetical protein
MAEYPIELAQALPVPCEGRRKRRYHESLFFARTSMKPSLHLKVWILLGYVLLCTMLVLFDQQTEVQPPDQDVLRPGALQVLPVQ